MISGGQSPSRGFTIVELLTAVAVSAILAAVAIPSFADLLASRRVQSTASGLGQALKSAQAEAIRRNRLVEVIFTTSEPVPAETVGATARIAGAATAFMVRVVNPQGAGDFITGQTIGEDGATTIDSAGVTSIGFTPMGRPMNLSAAPGAALAQSIVLRVTDTRSSRRMCVALATGGSVRVCDPKRATGSAAACQPALAAGAC